jgi:hypothetical protein
MPGIRHSATPIEPVISADALGACQDDSGVKLAGGPGLPDIFCHAGGACSVYWVDYDEASDKRVGSRALGRGIAASPTGLRAC